MKFLFIEKPFKKNNKIIENLIGIGFGFGDASDDSTSDTTNVNINKDSVYESTIDRGTVIDATTKLVNDVITNVSQQNSAEVFNSVGASNMIWINNIECDVFNYSNSYQDSSVIAENYADIAQENISKITTNIVNSISKSLTNNQPESIEELTDGSHPAMKKFLESSGGIDPGMVMQFLDQDPLRSDKEWYDFGGSYTPDNVEKNLTIQEKLQSTFKLNQSFTLENNEEVEDAIENNIVQTNLSTCSQSSVANNIINISNIRCNTINFDNIDQEAYAESILTCIINQEMVSEIANKILNKIDTDISNMIGAIEYPEDPEDIERIQLLKDAALEQIINAAGMGGGGYDVNTADSLDTTSGINVNDSNTDDQNTTTTTSTTTSTSDDNASDNNDTSNGTSTSDNGTDNGDTSNGTSTSDNGTDNGDNSNSNDSNNNIYQIIFLIFVCILVGLIFYFIPRVIK